MTKKVLITGATGFLGQNLVEYLSRHDYEIIGTWKHHEPKSCFEHVRYSQVDLGGKQEVDQLFTATFFDAVIHLAGHMKGMYIKDFLKNSVDVTDYLISAAQKHGVETFIYASSLSVHGHTADIVQEHSDRTNLSDYGMAKYIGERLLEDSSIKNRVSIRLPRMLGKHIDLSYPWLPKLAKDLMANREIRYFNPNLLYNNLAHTDTLSEFLTKIVDDTEASWKGYHTIELGSAEPASVIGIIKQMREGLHSASPLYELKENLPRHTCFLIDISRAQQCGYKPWTVKRTLDRFIEDLKEGAFINEK